MTDRYTLDLEEIGEARGEGEPAGEAAARLRGDRPQNSVAKRIMGDDPDV